MESGSAAVLMAVVEVDPIHRVKCRADGCGRPVYKRIHVVKDGDALLVLGSDCYERLYEGRVKDMSGAIAFGGEGRLLTEDERALLESNTQALLEMFEKEQAMIAEIEAELREPVAGATPIPWAIEPRRLVEQKKPQKIGQWYDDMTSDEREEFGRIRIQVEAEFRERYRIDPNQHGWAGWVKTTTRKRMLEGMERQAHRSQPVVDESKGKGHSGQLGLL